MKIIQNFTSNTHYRTIPLTDIVIWKCGLQNLKVYNHTIKLYCKTSDLDFLKEWELDKMYDEIDTAFLDNWKSPIDDTNFWSIRKLACIEHEFKINTEQFIYMDTDIIINMPLSCPSDILVWGQEPEGGVYIDWKYLSLPQNYTLPDWLAQTVDAYNCGILAFKSKDIFNYYLDEYYKFTLNNPCILDESIKATDLEKRAIWACNAEQRILKGIIDNLDLEPTAITISPHAHTSEEGIHYYIWRHAWRSLLEWPDQYFEDERAFAISMLNQTIIGCLNILFPEDRDFLLAKSDVLRDLYNGVSLLESYV